MDYTPPRRPSHSNPYEDSNIYNGQTPPPPIHTPQEQGQYYPPPSPQHQPVDYRRRASSNATRHSQHSQHPPSPNQQAQQLTPYAHPSPQQQQHQLAPYGLPSPQQQQLQHHNGYFPPGPGRPMTPNQLHPSEAYGQDPFAYRQRRESATSHKSSHSQRSHHSGASRKSGEHWGDRKDGQRATFGDSLFGIWDTLRNLIPANKR